MELRPFPSLVAEKKWDLRHLQLIEVHGPDIGLFGQRRVFQSKDKSSAVNEFELVIHSVSGVPQGKCRYIKTASS